MDGRTKNASGPRLRRMVAAGLLVAGSVAMLGSRAVAGSGGADPKGNNGTVKIDGVALQSGQANEPHVDCQFAVEFFGYDKGDLKATVSFELQSPTRRASGSQVLLTDTVAIGQDAAGGGTDLDASRLYTLDFTGVKPQANQGYHVKLTVHADGSQGADTKHKVFWVAACPAPTTTTTTTTSTTTTSSSTTTTTGTNAVTTVTSAAPTTTTTTTVAVGGQQETATTAPTQVLGEQVARPGLPRTGRNTGRLAMLGALALTLGGFTLRCSRPRQA